MDYVGCMYTLGVPYESVVGGSKLQQDTVLYLSQWPAQDLAGFPCDTLVSQLSSSELQVSITPDPMVVPQNT